MRSYARRSKDSYPKSYLNSSYSIDSLVPAGSGNSGGGSRSGGDDDNVYEEVQQEEEDLVITSSTKTTKTTSVVGSRDKSIRSCRIRNTITPRSRSSTTTSTSPPIPRDESNCNGSFESKKLVPNGVKGKVENETRALVTTGTPSNNNNTKGTKRYRNSTPVSGTKKRATSPLKPSSNQPKQILHPPTKITRISRKGMQTVFQPWVEKTYGDTAKTKTITRKKYTRIIRTLRGEEVNNAENSKFRFWVKSKGFHIGPPPGFLDETDDDSNSIQPLSSLDPQLFVPTTIKDETGGEQFIYKKVAVVEQFFDIIYTVHVETEAKNGKHAGQKRTYRAITEKYAFLPREAVTKFLLQCTDCQKRGGNAAQQAAMAAAATASANLPTTVLPDSTSSVSPTGKFDVHETDSLSSPDKSNRKGNSRDKKDKKTFSATTNKATTTSTPPQLLLSPKHSNKSLTGKRTPKIPSSSSPFTPKSESEHEINFTLPFTTTYMRNKQREQMSQENAFSELTDDDNDEENQEDVEMKEDRDSRASDPNSLEDDHQDHVIGSKKRAKYSDKSGGHSQQSVETNSEISSEWLGFHPLSLSVKKDRLTPTNNNNSIYTNGKHDFKEQTSPLSLSDRQTSSIIGAIESAIQPDETSSNGNKEDEDDDDDESEDKIDTHSHDPERLKAFNMFVRLFVDENLDRMVPISKQPKEKIQAIIDSCTRQFPEFAERARKRIRTYLKSCRRNKRTRDSGWESTRPTPAHLTSVQAEQILAQACENESQNAKRMRMGLEPVGQPMPSGTINGKLSTSSSTTQGESVGNGHSKDTEKDHNSNHTSSSSPDTKLTKGGATTNTSSTTSSIPTTISGTSTNSLANGISIDGPHLSHLAPRSPLSSGSSSSDHHGSGLTIKPTPERGTVPAHLTDYRALQGNGFMSSMYRPVNGSFCQGLGSRRSPFPSLFPSPTNGLEGSGLSNGTSTTTSRPFSHTNNNLSPIPSVPLALSNGLGDIGPTDLSMKSTQNNNSHTSSTSTTNPAKPLLQHKLNSTEMSTVRQLITGYRESAAFLLRSADELEQLLVQQ